MSSSAKLSPGKPIIEQPLTKSNQDILSISLFTAFLPLSTKSQLKPNLSHNLNASHAICGTENCPNLKKTPSAIATSAPDTSTRRAKHVSLVRTGISQRREWLTESGSRLGSLQRKIRRGRVRDIVVLNVGIVGWILRPVFQLLLIKIGDLWTVHVVLFMNAGWFEL